MLSLSADSQAYANDTQVYISTPATDHSEAMDCLTMCIMRIHDWTASNRLKLSEDKTQIIWLGTRQQSYINFLCLINWLFYSARHLSLKKWTSLCCMPNCDFVYYLVYGPTVLQLQLKSDAAKSGSGQILSVRYPNPLSGRKSIRPSLAASTCDLD